MQTKLQEEDFSHLCNWQSSTKHCVSSKSKIRIVNDCKTIAIWVLEQESNIPNELHFKTNCEGNAIVVEKGIKH